MSLETRTRYFKATAGLKTYMRASPTRVYRSMSLGRTYKDWQFHMHARGSFEVVEIDRAEFVKLMELKRQRTSDTAPSDSWIFNSALAREVA